MGEKFGGELGTKGEAPGEAAETGQRGQRRRRREEEEVVYSTRVLYHTRTYDRYMQYLPTVHRALPGMHLSATTTPKKTITSTVHTVVYSVIYILYFEYTVYSIRWYSTAVLVLTVYQY